MEPNPFRLTNWHADPVILVGALLLTLAYAYGTHRLAARGEPPTRLQALCFAGAILTVFVALASPLHDLSDNYLFSAHMVQHLLLILLMPPLLLVSLPAAMLRPLLSVPGLHAAMRVVTRAPVAYFACNLVFAASHLPNFYELTLRDHGVHVVEHLVFMATAVILWWPILSPLPELPRLSYPGQLLYVFAQVLPGLLIGGLITNTLRPIYPFYAAAPRVTALTPVQDQQLGALIMWVGGGFFFLIVFTVIWFRWAAPDIAAQSRPLAPRR